MDNTVKTAQKPAEGSKPKRRYYNRNKKPAATPAAQAEATMQPTPAVETASEMVTVETSEAVSQQKRVQQSEQRKGKTLDEAIASTQLATATAPTTNVGVVGGLITPVGEVPAKLQNTQQQHQGQKNSAQRGRGRKPEESAAPIRIIPLGGLNEIGKNMTVYESGEDIIIVDCGLAFPDDEMFGVDIVIPDFTYVIRNKHKIKGIVITHAHEDHIGALSYLLKQINIPVYGARLTIGLIEGKLKEHGLLGRVKLIETPPGSSVKLGCFDVEFIPVNHSIPDACALAISTPAGLVIQTGDFKVDYTPIHGPVIDLARFGELGSKGVLALLSDSTNVEKSGMTPSERTVGDSFDSMFKRAGKKRIIIASFSSNVHRLQQVADSCVKYGRKMAVSGRSMINMVTKAGELGYLNVPDGLIIDVDVLNRYSDEQVVLMTTGSQGEPMSALTRMAMSDHRKVTITPNDFIIISASPIPGNEKTVSRVINELMKLGADVIYEKMYDLHVSGHACQDELKLMLSLTKPKFFIPVHGEFRHLKKHADLAVSTGVPAANILIGDIGKVMELSPNELKFAGVVPAGSVMVDGLGVGDVGSIVLRDRKHLAQDGLIIVVVAMDASSGEVLSGPDIVSRGFVYVREAEEMMTDARQICVRALENCQNNNVHEWSVIKNAIKDQLGQFLFGRTKRSPMILPIIQEI